MATAILLPAPELQFLDADGKPYAGGSVATYVPGTTTPKATWVDPGEAALNTNPVILDAAGRCIIYGDGDYRVILRDAAGNLIYDQLSSTVISAAMEPVVSAPTIADAKVLLGITGFASSADLASAISTEQTARIAADSAEITARTNADNAEITARTNADANLQSQIDAINAALGGSSPLTVQRGSAVTDGSAHVHVTFATSYASTPAVVATCTASAPDVIIVDVGAVSSTGFDAWTAYGNPGVVPFPGNTIYWVAVGPT